MASRCSRIYRSSSNGEISVLNNIRPVESSVAKWENSDDFVAKLEAIPKKSIFRFDSPEKKRNDDDKVDKQFGKFFEVCSLASCKKKIGKDKDVYMYGYLGAFCSMACREDQIIMDAAFGPPSMETKAATAAMTSSARQAIRTQDQKRLAIPRFK